MEASPQLQYRSMADEYLLQEALSTLGDRRHEGRDSVVPLLSIRLSLELGAGVGLAVPCTEQPKCPSTKEDLARITNKYPRLDEATVEAGFSQAFRRRSS